MKIKIFPIILILSFTIIFFIFYKGLNNSNIYIPDMKIEKDIPYFKANILENDKIITSDKIFENDKFYLMNIWSSWCVPCREEHSFLLSLKRNNNIEIIGLNYKDDDEKAKKFLIELESPYSLIISDQDGTIAIEWGAYGVPETFVIYNRKIIKKFIGPLNNDSLIKIKSLIK